MSARGGAAAAGEVVAAAMLLVLTSLPSLARAAPHPLPGPEVDPTLGVQISFATCFWEAPTEGYVPIQVTLRNDGARSREYQLAFEPTVGWQAGGTSSSFTVSAEPGTTRTFELTVPLGGQENDGTRFTRLQVSVYGPGVRGGGNLSLYQTHYATPSGGGEVGAPVAMSESAAGRYWEPLKSVLDATHKTTLVGGRFDPAALPADWRGYLGYSLVVLTAEEWAGLAPEAQHALEQWVARGGRLVRLGEAAPRAALALGTIDTLSAATPDATATLAGLLNLVRTRPPAGEYTSWPPVHELGAPPLPVTAVSLFMIAYAVLVGPVNLFLATRGARRNRALRVMWTIPALSFAASLLLAVTIVVKDGTGGDGHRVTLMALLPERHEAVVLQEQIERTGLIFGTSFRAREPFAITRLAVEEDRPGRSDRRGESGEVHTGWIHSRALQAQWLETVRASRVRLERSEGPRGEPEILSSLPDTLEHVYWCDDAGRYWHAADVVPGRKTALQPVADAEFLGFWHAREFWMGPRLRAAAAQVAPPGRSRNVAFASAVHAHGGIETLESLRWPRRDAVFIQPLR